MVYLKRNHDFANIFNSGVIRLNSFEIALQKIKQDELQCVDILMNYFYFYDECSHETHRKKIECPQKANER